MCIIREQKPKKKVLEARIDDKTLLYYKLVSKGDPDHFDVKSDQMAFVVCFDGKEIPVNEPGVYRLVAKPVKIIWINKVPRDVKIGVPKEATGVNLGFHARIRLYPTQWNKILDLIEGSSEETWVKVSDIRDDLREFALSAFRATFNDMESDMLEYRKKFNVKLNELLMGSKLSGFTAVTSYFGLSSQCKQPIEEVESI